MRQSMFEVAVALGVDHHQFADCLSSCGQLETFMALLGQLSFQWREISRVHLTFPHLFVQVGLPRRVSVFDKFCRDDPPRCFRPQGRPSNRGSHVYATRYDVLAAMEAATRVEILRLNPGDIHRAFVLALLQQTIRHRGIENLRVTLSAYAPIVARLPWESFIDAEGLVEGRVQLRYQGVLILDEESGTYEFFWEALHDFASTFVTYLPNEFVLLGEEFVKFLPEWRRRRCRRAINE